VESSRSLSTAGCGVLDLIDVNCTIIELGLPCASCPTVSSLSRVLLHPLHEEVNLSRVLAEVNYGSARALDALLGGAISLHLSETDPLAELLGAGYLHQGDVVLVAHGLDELLVRRLIAVSGQTTKASSAAVQHSGNPARKCKY